MKAIRVHEFGGPEVLRLEEVGTPKPSAGEVLVRIHAAGVNPYDTYMRAGTYAVKPPLPYTPGSDAAGVVEAVGDGVQKVKRGGSRVYREDPHRCICGIRTLGIESARFRDRTGTRRKWRCRHRGAPNRPRASAVTALMVNGPVNLRGTTSQLLAFIGRRENHNDLSDQPDRGDAIGSEHARFVVSASGRTNRLQ